MAGPPVLILFLVAVIGIPLAIAALIYLIVPVCTAIVWVVKRVVRFVFGVVSDALRLVGAVVASLVLMLLVVGSVIVGRWSSSAHYGRAVQAEFVAMGRSLYRLVIGHPARLLCLEGLTDGLERRIPEVVAAAPGADRPRGKAAQYEGYTIIGSLPGGGSGGKLYIAEPELAKQAALERSSKGPVGQVVIKSFSLGEGSSLPQIVRENRALDAAKRLGLILEHALTPERFYYVMHYVPGESLGLVTQRLHAVSAGRGLEKPELAKVLDYTGDLLRTLCHYHGGGLWHKDVKPDNIIVSDDQAHLVDFGLVTPLRSAMTLTTHGTEYFRDPELVRMALKGVKVHEVDGAKFDVYAAGAVLYSMIENSFPAHGGLSQIGKPCPEAVRWIVRRAMTDYDKRYETAAAMLADVEAVASAADAFAVRPVDLPSMGGASESERAEAVAGGAGAGRAAWEGAGSVGAGFRGAVGARSPVPPAGRGGSKPLLRVTNWWTGRYEVEGREERAAGSHGAAGAAAPNDSGFVFKVRAGIERPVGARQGGGRGRSTGTAREQLERARARAESARARVKERMKDHGRQHASGLNLGVGASVVLFLVLVAGAVAFMMLGPRVAVPVAQEQPSEPAGNVRIAGDRPASSGVGMTGLPQGVELRGGAARRVASARAGGETVLVVRESVTQGPEEAAAFNRRMAALRGAGFELIGDTDRPPADENEAAEQTELVAGLRNALGVLVFASDAAHSAALEWLKDHGQVAMIVWAGRDENGRPLHWIVPRDDTERERAELAGRVMAGR